MKPYTAVLIIPTGVGATVGGYAGDGLPTARAFAQVADTLITHPNVMNGASLYWNSPNILYVEGYALDQFAHRCWGLEPVRQNKIGLILDAGIEEELRWRHLQVAEAARATLGLHLTDYVVTDAPLGVELRQAESGASWGTIANPDSLLRSAEVVVSKAAAEAIAIVTRFPDDLGGEALQNYRYGQGVDPIAGAEAVISHLVVRKFRVPAAHTPALSPLPLDIHISPKAAAEELGYTFLPCVLVGLSRAPRFTLNPSRESIWGDDVDVVIVPATACGGSALLSLAALNTTVIAVQDNNTCLDVPPEVLGIKVIRVNSYLEALGVLVCHKSGINTNALGPLISSLHLIQ